jgi:hypothetical protein
MYRELMNNVVTIEVTGPPKITIQERVQFIYITFNREHRLIYSTSKMIIIDTSRHRQDVIGVCPRKRIPCIYGRW